MCLQIYLVGHVIRKMCAHIKAILAQKAPAVYVRTIKFPYRLSLWIVWIVRHEISKNTSEYHYNYYCLSVSDRVKTFFGNCSSCLWGGKCSKLNRQITFFDWKHFVSQTIICITSDRSKSYSRIIAPKRHKWAPQNMAWDATKKLSHARKA